MKRNACVWGNTRDGDNILLHGLGDGEKTVAGARVTAAVNACVTIRYSVRIKFVRSIPGRRFVDILTVICNVTSSVFVAKRRRARAHTHH